MKRQVLGFTPIMIETAREMLMTHVLATSRIPTALHWLQTEYLLRLIFYEPVAKWVQ